MIIIETFARWSQPRAPRIGQTQPGGLARDPARTGPHSGRSNGASADGPSCARCRAIAIRWFASTIIPARETAAPRANTATKLPARHAAATVEPLPTSAKNQFPIASACSPRVRSSDDFRTPPAPETLQESGLAASDVQC